MSNIYKNLFRPIMFRFSAETAHEVGIRLLKTGLATEAAQNIAAKRFATKGFDTLKRFGLEFESPLGMAAGFDKNGIVVNQLASLGFGFVEVGTVTIEPQSGNPKPRLFRLPKDSALINRLGFNNDGTGVVVDRLQKIEPKCVLGVNIGKNKDVEIDVAIENYLKSFDLVYQVADYIAVNVSSPNTPNLRELQKAENLEDLLRELKKRNRDLGGGREKPLLVKIAPDLDESEIETIVGITMDLSISGIIATNTTIGREGLNTSSRVIENMGQGGLSGKPIRARSNEVIKKIHKFSGGECQIIGVGGVFTAEDAFEKIAAGACLIQAYTGFVYGGPTFARDINTGLAEIISERGFKDLDEAVGSGANE